MAFQVKADDAVLTAQPGEMLLDCLRRAGLAPDAPCGGHGTCGKCTVLVDGREVLSCKYPITSDISVILPEKQSAAILTSGLEEETAVRPLKGGYLAAFDIGTTTVVCSLMDTQGREIALSSMLNPQSPYGADVVSRIQRALLGDMEAMTRAIRDGMGDLLLDCCRRAEITPKEIGVVSVVGNPCMRQLFLGISPENLASIPFAPAVTTVEIAAASMYLPACVNAVMPLLPDISGYVGTDTLGCVLAAKLHEAADTVLLVDIGTNGEMVLCHRDSMVACSTAAGPALEGANIRFGMRGSTGAIDHVFPDGYSVIGGGEAAGICGSGIVDAVAVMLRKGLLNKRGRLLTQEHNWFITPDICLTQEDIRQVQLAKGAVAAGIELMCTSVGITPEKIDRCILAGAFGSFLNPDSACRIGLLPESLQGKIQSVGNGALVGAKMLAKDKKQMELAGKLVGEIQVLELASLPEFQRTFAKTMGFREETVWKNG